MAQRERAPKSPDAVRPDRTSGDPGLAARRFAVDILAEVLEGHRPLDRVLDHRATMPAYRALSPADRALVRALVATCLRRLGLVDDAIRRMMEKQLPAKALRAKQILRIGATQVLFMEVPDHAAVSLATELADRDRDARPWKALVNGVLRSLVRRRDEVLADQDAERLVTPLWLWREWSETWGEDAARAFARVHMVEPALDLTVKSDAAGWAERLGGIVLPTGSVRVIAHGRIERLDGFEEGEWWIQDAAAALPARLLGDVAGLRVADLCAAPGGKTAQLAAAGAKVTAVDISAGRLDRLKQNLARLHLDGVEAVTADLGVWTPDEAFDAVLLDAPCSATGTLRRNPDVGRLKKATDVEDLGHVQSYLLSRAVDWVKPGGLFVYCTCSLQKAEGEDQIAAFLAGGAPFDRVPITADEVGGLADAITADGALRTRPDQMPDVDPRLGGLDGFYAVRLRRRP
ncbi:methyltransferase domain-containing protein [Siculibacillus lacustris]|uniref:Methyltransferase domain-containing protein n=1 Tax=Siculibacillus lacustris TaxID=1549641 RepID=A0A4Q9VXK7_9HYPH|nr:RsmB/NOP family class I SAM-dependent RNA methyltransferase [Siculibacillus lacustris]TBW40067.1 methyltransferase domain-containing protein [Siculibacillus lacustris]